MKFHDISSNFIPTDHRDFQCFATKTLPNWQKYNWLIFELQFKFQFEMRINCHSITTYLFSHPRSQWIIHTNISSQKVTVMPKFCEILMKIRWNSKIHFSVFEFKLSEISTSQTLHISPKSNPIHQIIAFRDSLYRRRVTSAATSRSQCFHRTSLLESGFGYRRIWPTFGSSPCSKYLKKVETW
jgi:hypothetical protein